ncbi:MAG: AI-2E family transporter [Oscillospiraceae bacterium]|nr:AI-2E family transporter [Oscillospiraceae bacterium]
MQIDKKTIKTLVLGIMSCILLYWFLNDMERVKHLASGLFKLLQPFLVGACIAFVLNVPMRAIERQIRRVPGFPAERAVSIVLTLGSIVLVVALMVRLLVPQIRETAQIIADQLPPFISGIEKQLFVFLEKNPQVANWLWEYTDVDNIDWKALADQAIDFVRGGLSTFLGNTVGVVRGFISSVWSILVSLVFSLYCLSNKEQLVRQGRRLVYSFLPERWADEIIRVGRLSNTTFSNFLSGQCIEVTILGAMFALAMTLLRLPYVALVSVLVAVTAFVPIVGAWIGCVLGAFFILVNDPMQAVVFLVMFLVLQQIENNLIYPRVVGTSVGLPGMWTLAAVTVGADLMGVAGMVLMIPVCSVLYTLVSEYTQDKVKVKGIDPEKLKDQPLVLKSRLREKREHIKRKREAKIAAQRAAELASKMREKLHLTEHHDQKE